jgi:hypothetical protein
LDPIFEAAEQNFRLFTKAPAKSAISHGPPDLPEFKIGVKGFGAISRQDRVWLVLLVPENRWMSFEEAIVKFTDEEALALSEVLTYMVIDDRYEGAKTDWRARMWRRWNPEAE